MATGYTKALALFQRPPTDVGIDHISYIDYKPVSSISDGSPIDFLISGNTSNYIDLQKCKLKLKLRIVGSDGTLLTESKDNVGLCNLPLSSLFSMVDVSLNQQPIVSMGLCHYPYMCMLDLLCKCTDQQMESHLQSQLFFKDVNTMDQNDITQGSNIGYVRRCTYTENSKIVDMEGALNVGFFQTERMLLNGVELLIKLTPSANAFRLMAKENGNDYKVEIVDISFRCAMVRVNAGVILGHSQALSQSPAVYPYNNKILKTYNIPTGSYSASFENLFLNTLPEKLIIAMVESHSFTGNFAKNPFNFRHFDLNHCSLYIDFQSIPNDGLKLDFANDQYISGYETLFGKQDDGTPITSSIISRNDYKNGYSIIILPLTENVNTEYVAQKKHAHSRLELRFKKQLEQSVTLIVYGIYQSTIEIDKSRSVLVK